MDTHVRRSPTDAEPSRRTVGIDVGGTKTLGLLVEHGPAGVAVLDRERVPSRADDPSAVDAVVGVARTLTERSRNRAGEAVPVPVAAVGVGLAGFVDRDGVVRAAPNSVGLVGQDVRGRLERELGLPVTVDNDANCAAVAAHALIEPTVADLVAVTLGTGIGGGLIVGGRLVRGARGFAGEPGHMIIDPTGPRCPCGRRGCWERYASGTGLGRLGREAAVAGRAAQVLELAGGDTDAILGEHVTAAATGGDAEALAIMAEFGRWVALGIANLVAVLDSEVVIIGGGLIEAGSVVMDPIRAAFPSLLFGGAVRPGVPVEAASLGENSGAIGAALLAAQRTGSSTP